MATTVTLKPNAIDLSGSTSGTTTLQATAVAGTTTITLPAATDTLVGKATTDTLTNKTLTTPVISTISNTGTLTLPTSTDTLVGRATTDTLTNKTLTSPTLTTPALGTPASGVMTNVTGINYDGYKNRIINGAMVINQRATSVTATAFTVDRFEYVASQSSKATISQDTSVYPTGFNASLKALSSSAYTVGASEVFMVRQSIEGFNSADLGWGTANAKTVTLSFWVYSSLTGTFGGAIENNDGNRCYVYSYSIPVANTWTQITATIAGDTTGTWVGATNGIGLRIAFTIGAGSTVSGTAGSWGSTRYFSVTGATSVVGTNGATFYITGVQLEKGSTATSFDYRPYTTELSLCQRYYWICRGDPSSGYAAVGSGTLVNSAAGRGYVKFPVTMRTLPTLSYGGTIRLNSGGTTADVTSVSNNYTGIDSSMFEVNTAGGFTTGYGCIIHCTNSTSSYIYGSAEL